MAKYNKDIKRKLYEYFKVKMGMWDYRKGWLKGDCPECGKENKFGVNLGTNRTNCFVCGYNPKPTKVIMDHENYKDFAELKANINSFEGMDFFVDKSVNRMQLKKDAILPEGFRALTVGNSMLAKGARNNLKKRGFNIDELAMAGFGYGTAGKYYGYIIMPFYIKGQLTYFNARRYMSNGPKYNNPNEEDFGIGKSILIYNIDALWLYDKIFIVESVLNARTLGDNAIAGGGKKFSEYQINVLIKSPVKRFVLLLDPDAYQEAIELALRLVDYKKVKVILLPGDNDVNDLGKYRTLNRVANNHYLTYNELLKIKLSL
jgi:DNA primase